MDRAQLRDEARKVDQPHREPGDNPREVCCTCGLRGRQCMELPCWHYEHITMRGLVYR